jgi:hypothetical protein
MTRKLLPQAPDNSINPSRHAFLQSRSHDTAPKRSSTFIFTRTPYAKEDIPLAGLVPDKRYPHQDVLSVIQVKEGQDCSVRVDKAFSQRILVESKSSFKTIITRLFSASVDIETSDTFQVSSAEGRIYELRQPKALFGQLCNREEVQRWLEDNYIGGDEIYFIIGYRTLMNGKLGYQDHRSASVFTRDHLVVKAADKIDPIAESELAVEVTAGHGHDSGSKGNFETLGERVYAICYRKVGFKFLKGVGGAFLKSGNRWKPFFSVRGSDPTVDEIVEADIEDDDESGDDTCEKFNTDYGEETFVCLSDAEGEEEAG